MKLERTIGNNYSVISSLFLSLLAPSCYATATYYSFIIHIKSTDHVLLTYSVSINQRRVFLTGCYELTGDKSLNSMRKYI